MIFERVRAVYNEFNYMNLQLVFVEQWSKVLGLFLGSPAGPGFKPY